MLVKKSLPPNAGGEGQNAPGKRKEGAEIEKRYYFERAKPVSYSK
jgi:hypothetical protein